MIKLYYKRKMVEDLLRDDLLDHGWNQKTFVGKLKLTMGIVNKRKGMIYRILFKDFISLRHVELVLTTKCSLRCKECANLMQYYDKPYDVGSNTLKKSYNKLLDLTDRIGNFVLIGGEPLLSKELYLILEDLNKEIYSQIENIIIFTNGTIVPKGEEAIHALQNPKVLVTISDYGKISGKKMELVEYCKKNGIRYYLKNEDLYWGYVGKPEARGRSEQELAQQFRKCKNKCRSLLNGKLFYCPRASHGDDLKKIGSKLSDYVDLLNDQTTVEDLLKVVYSKKHFTACDYCNYGTKEMVPITPGEQVKVR